MIVCFDPVNVTGLNALTFSVLNLINFERESLRPRRSLTLHVRGRPWIACLLRWQDQVLEEGRLVLLGALRLAVNLLR